MNTELLEKVKEAILAEPRRLDMHEGLIVNDDPGHKCGTVGCIAGWAVALSKNKDESKYKEIARDYRIEGDYKSDWIAIQDEAKKVLGIKMPYSSELFYLDYWPRKFKEKYYLCEELGDSEGMAQVTAERIDDLIEEIYEQEATDTN